MLIKIYCPDNMSELLSAFKHVLLLKTKCEQLCVYLQSFLCRTSPTHIY